MTTLSRIGRVVSLLLLGVPLALAGCVPREPGFQCTSTAQCVAGDGSQGMCEPSGYCSFADATCAESGRRYGEAVPEEHRGQCVGIVGGGRCVEQLAAGGAHTCALKTDGSVWCWGDNALGQLGDGTTTARAAPVQVEALSGLSVVQLSGGAEHTCALTSGGELYCWGGNEDGQLGVVDAGGMKVSGSPVPVLVKMPPEAPQGVGAQAFSAGGKHTCSVLVDGSVWCWGENAAFQLGDGTSDERPLPVQTQGISKVVAVANGDEHTCAIRDDGSLHCWGSNANGQLGVLDITSAPTPVHVTSLTSVAELAGGDEHTCIRKPDATIWCWGYNGSGSVGNGGGDDVRVPLKILTGERIISNGIGFHTCAWTHDEGGVLSCWGSNDRGQIGHGKDEKVVPVPARAKIIAATGAVTGGSHTCALTKDGALWCWGDNESGQLGIGKAGGRFYAPVFVPICP